MFSTNASFPRKAANPSAMLTRPSRIDFTSCPWSASPHSKVSRISYSCRARRFVETTFTEGLSGFSFLPAILLRILSLRGGAVRRLPGDNGQPYVGSVRLLQQFSEKPVALSARVVHNRKIGRFTRSENPAGEIEGGSPLLRRRAAEFPAQHGVFPPSLIQGMGGAHLLPRRQVRHRAEAVGPESERDLRVYEMGDVRSAVPVSRIAPRAKDEAGASRVQSVDLGAWEVDIMHQQPPFPQKTDLGEIRGDRPSKTMKPGDVLSHGGVQARGDLPSPIGKE